MAYFTTYSTSKNTSVQGVICLKPWSILASLCLSTKKWWMWRNSYWKECLSKRHFLLCHGDIFPSHSELWLSSCLFCDSCSRTEQVLLLAALNRLHFSLFIHRLWFWNKQMSLDMSEACEYTSLPPINHSWHTVIHMVRLNRRPHVSSPKNEHKPGSQVSPSLFNWLEYASNYCSKFSTQPA